MALSNILVVAVDGLRTSALGAYGNTSYPTPALDQLAADSLLFDWCFAPAVELAAIYRALWQSVHPRRVAARAATSSAPATTGASLPRLLADRGYSTTLVTDDAELLWLMSSADFEQCVQVRSESSAGAAATRVESTAQTEMAQLFAAACETVGSQTHEPDSARLVWVHSRGMYGAWDAPLELQDSLLDEGDPPPLESTIPPDIVLGPNEDPDAAFQYATAYAAQVMVLDECWGGLQNAVQSAGTDNWLLMLLGARGYPLGEHRRLGGVDSRLYAEQLHVPWLIHFPGGRERLSRSSQLVSHVDLLPTIVDWLNDGRPPGPAEFDGMSVLPSHANTRAASQRALLSISSLGDRAIRTDAWCLRQDARPIATDEALRAKSELFVRPDDRWEANDIAKLCHDVIDELEKTLDETV